MLIYCAEIKNLFATNTLNLKSEQLTTINKQTQS